MRIFLAILFLSIVSLAAEASEALKVPYGFAWGDSSTRVQLSLKNSDATVVETKNVRGRKCLVVEGIPQKMLLRALFYFENDALNEIELQYGDPAWDGIKFSTFVEETRRNIEKKYGVGRIVARSRTREGDVTQNLLGYQWVQPATTLALYSYTAEQGASTLRLMSLHYRGF